MYESEQNLSFFLAVILLVTLYCILLISYARWVFNIGNITSLLAQILAKLDALAPVDKWEKCDKCGLEVHLTGQEDSASITCPRCNTTITH